MLPYWAKRLGVKTVILSTTGGWEPNSIVDEMLTSADRLGMTFGFTYGGGAGGSIGDAGAGTPNTGGGGGGIWDSYPAAGGGSGIVIVRYVRP